MSDRRYEMLREMGLTPIWRLRAPVAATEVVAEPAVGKPAAPVERISGPAPVSARVVARPTSSGNGDERRVQILNMDWAALKACVSACTACKLHEKRNKTAFGVGDENADWLFIGEGPGAEEDAKGEPFVGQAGRLLDNMLAAVDLKRGANVYIGNVVKCRPPGNRNPEPSEAAQCEPFLTRQIALIQPRLIVALGKVAAQNLLATDASIASMRGRVHDYRGIPLIVTYHPAYLLRTLADKAKAWTDLCFARETMARLVAAGKQA